MTLFFGAMLAAGVVCLAGTPSAHARLALMSGVAVIVWWCIWLTGAHAAIALLPEDIGRGPGGAAFATFTVASTALLPVAAAALAILFRRGLRRPRLAAVLLAPAWAAGAILPGLGRGGIWPADSIFLAIAVMALSLLLGGLLAAVPPTAKAQEA